MISVLAPDHSALCFLSGLKDVVDDVIERGSLVALIATAHSDDSLHPSLREAQGTHFLQSFARIQSPDQVNSISHNPLCSIPSVKFNTNLAFLSLQYCYKDIHLLLYVRIYIN